jgi:anion-transporting  ArsA/GET3 family ATPase
MATAYPAQLPAAPADSGDSLELEELDCQCPQRTEGQHRDTCHFVRPLTKELRETIADQVFLGMSTLEIARLHTLDPSYVRRQLATAVVKRRVNQRREQVMAQAGRAYFRFLMVADQLAEAQVREALDPTSPNQYRARVYILDQVLPKRSITAGETTTNIQVNTQVLTELRDAVQGAQRARELEVHGAPSLIPGKQALPPIISSDE